MSEVEIPLSMPGISMTLPSAAIDAARQNMVARFERVCRDVTTAGQALDAAENAPRHIRDERLKRYLTAIETFADMRDALKRRGVIYA